MVLPPSFTSKYGPWAVVTGASSGIGAEFARQLAVAGFCIVLVARRRERLQTLSDTIQASASVQTRIVVADLSTEEGCQKTFAETSDLDVGLLINNAGVGMLGTFLHFKSSEHLNLLKVNCMAVTQLAHSFGKRFADNGRGGIIFVSSVAATPVAYMASYSASKSYVTSLGLIMRDELRQRGVEVMVLEPGFVESEMTEDTKFDCMPTEECVSQTLSAFGGCARFTPGWKSSTLTWIRRMLPVTFQIGMLSSFMKNEVEKEGLLKDADRQDS